VNSWCPAQQVLISVISIDAYQSDVWRRFPFNKTKTWSGPKPLNCAGQCDLFHQLQWLYLKWTMKATMFKIWFKFYLCACDEILSCWSHQLVQQTLYCSSAHENQVHYIQRITLQLKLHLMQVSCNFNIFSFTYPIKVNCKTSPTAADMIYFHQHRLRFPLRFL
jgi:hypothetical protein